ncbi:LLM class flavin-dependent oxidoreductase [Streptomyces sp. NPDC057307]|uniref:LLM class flavin-dependent oxidoreductase n=1 Tax=Streptomyces sp. NPDC057307 TaxID=3346096 RepID=UPI0036385878
MLSEGRLEVGVGLGRMKDEHDISRSADWHRRGRMLDDLLAFLHEWWTANPVSWNSEFFSLPPVHAGLRPLQAGGPPIWIGGASEAAMRRVGRSATGWLGVDFLPDEVADQLWSLARQAAQEAGRDPDALKKAIRINLEPGTSVVFAGRQAQALGRVRCERPRPLGQERGAPRPWPSGPQAFNLPRHRDRSTGVIICTPAVLRLPRSPASCCRRRGTRPPRR